MSNFKQATREKVRFQTSKGSLSVEQLWDLSLQDLDNLAVSLQESYEKSKGKSFLDKRTTKDKGLKLQFDVVLEVLNDKVSESEAAKDAAEIKAHNQKIIDAIGKAKENELAGKSVKELEKMLK